MSTIEDVTTFYSRTDIFKYSYFPSTILEWNNLDMKIRKVNSLMSFKNSLLRVGRPFQRMTSIIQLI